MPASTPLAVGAKLAKRVRTCLEFFLCETAELSRSSGIAQVATRLASSGQSGHTEGVALRHRGGVGPCRPARAPRFKEAENEERNPTSRGGARVGGGARRSHGTRLGRRLGRPWRPGLELGRPVVLAHRGRRTPAGAPGGLRPRQPHGPQRRLRRRGRAAFRLRQPHGPRRPLPRRRGRAAGRLRHHDRPQRRLSHPVSHQPGGCPPPGILSPRHGMRDCETIHNNRREFLPEGKRVKIVSQSHVTEAEIEQAVRGDVGVSEVRRIVRHLCHCQGCRDLQRPRLSWLGAVLCAAEPAPVPLDAATEAAYDEAIDGALVKAANEIPRRRKHREKVARLIAWQRELPPYRLDDASLWFGPRSSDPPAEVLIEAFLAASQERRYRDPQAMLALASVAATVACRLSRPGEAKGMTQAQVTDLRVRVLAELANAHRLNDEFDTADATIDEALRALGSVGSGDLMLRNRLYDVRASLRTDQRRLGEALDLLDLIHTSYLEMGEKHLAGRALISQGIATAYADNPREAA